MKLDIGCGGNKKPGFSGVDINLGEQVDFVMDVQKLEFEDNCVDEIFSRRCIQHVEDDEKAFSEIFRVLKPNGIFTLEVASWYGWLYYRLHLSSSYGNYKIFHLYRDSKIKKKLEGAGFAIQSLRHISSPRGMGYDIQVISKKEVAHEKPTGKLRYFGYRVQYAIIQKADSTKALISEVAESNPWETALILLLMFVIGLAKSPSFGCAAAKTIGL